MGVIHFCIKEHILYDITIGLDFTKLMDSASQLILDMIYNTTQANVEHAPTNIQIFVNGAQKMDKVQLEVSLKNEKKNIFLNWSIVICHSPTPAYSEAMAMLKAILKCHQLHMIFATIYTNSQLMWR